MRIKKLLCSALIALSATVALLPSLGNKAADVPVEEPYTVEAEERGLFTKLQLSIEGGGGYVRAKVKNVFTLFPSTIVVHLELYCSDTYTEDYTEMNMKSAAFTPDLDQGNSIDVSARTYGKSQYWQARMYYKFDDNDWAYEVTPTFYADGDGNFAES